MSEQQKGAIAWMAQNPVASNLLMAVLILGGLIVGSQIKQEVFPEFDTDTISITVEYPGASPAEVEKAIILAIEEAVRGVDEVDRVISTAYEGSALLNVELMLGADTTRAVSDVKNEIDRISSFPRDAERPIVSFIASRAQVISLFVYGDTDPVSLRRMANRVRDDLLEYPAITEVDLINARPFEISVEIPRSRLDAYDLTLEEVADRIRSTAVELPGGQIRSRGGEILIRTAERRDLGDEFKDIVVKSAANGALVRLDDIATIKDGLSDAYFETTFDGLPAARIDIFRVGDQSPIDIASAVKDYMKKAEKRWPSHLKMGTAYDNSVYFEGRIKLLLKNGYLGLILVLVVLALFLETRLAIWVTLGIPASFFGSLLFLPSLDISINMISLFAFIVTLGMVVDDAIVVGENVFDMRQQGIPPLKAAILGAKQVATPVTFSIMTTIVAFTPMLLVPGSFGKFFRVIPAVVISILAISLIESLFVLPAHLAHMKANTPTTGVEGFLKRLQKFVAIQLNWVIEKSYIPAVTWATKNRYLTIALGVMLLMSALGLVASGRLPFLFMPDIDSDYVVASIRMPFGVPADETRRVQQQMVHDVEEAIKEYGTRAELVEGIVTELGALPNLTFFSQRKDTVGSSHLASVQVFLVPDEKRDVRASVIAKAWQKRARKIAGVKSMNFVFGTGPASGADINIQLSHRDVPVLERAADELARELGRYAGVNDVDNGYSGGKPQLDFHTTAEARSLGLTSTTIGRQLRAAFYGAEALRQQRGRDEIRVMVRLPAQERNASFTLEELLVRTPSGGSIPLSQAASFKRGRSYTTIHRTDGKRTLDVTANVDKSVGNANKVNSELVESFLPKLLAKYEGLNFSFEGLNRQQNESGEALVTGFQFALIVMFALLAIPFRSYIQPLIVMSSIPFGIVGAIAGHLLLGYDLSMMSFFGIVALAGVVVNDSLVFIDAANRKVAQGLQPKEAVIAAGARRFRPILLTSLTTFLGLMPMILERSVQARFLVPMAISLGFGVLFATFVTLIQVPAAFLIVEDLKKATRRNQHTSGANDQEHTA